MTYRSHFLRSCSKLFQFSHVLHPAHHLLMLEQAFRRLTKKPDWPSPVTIKFSNFKICARVPERFFGKSGVKVFSEFILSIQNFPSSVRISPKFSWLLFSEISSKAEFSLPFLCPNERRYSSLYSDTVLVSRMFKCSLVALSFCPFSKFYFLRKA